MNTQIVRRVVIALSLTMVLVLSACGTLQIDTEPAASQTNPATATTQIVEPAPTLAAEIRDVSAAESVALEDVANETAGPPEMVGYSDKESGITFSYPTNWDMEEETNAFLFRRGPVILRVGYRLPGDTADLSGRTGLGGTDVVALEGTAQFLGQALSRHGVNYDDVLIAVAYGGEPGTIVPSGAMEFTILLDDPDSDHQTLAINDEVLAEAETILASFAIDAAQGESAIELLSYANPDYGFTLHYPSTWTVAEVNDGDFAGPGSRSVQFGQGTAKLIIGYRRAGENVATGGSGAPAGEFELRGTVNVAGQNIDRYMLVDEGKDKAVMYGQPGSPPISIAGLEFALRMDDFAQAPYEDIELSQSVQEQADLIANSLTVTK